MRLTRTKARFARKLVQNWQEAGVLSREEATRLSGSIETLSFDWLRLARYAFWVAICCILISVGALLADEWILELIARLFEAPAAAKSAAFALVSTLLYAAGIRRRHRNPERVFSNEALLFLGVAATAASIAYFGEAVSTGSDHFSLLILMAAIIYAALGLWFPSKLVWVFALLSLGSWMGAETGYVSGWGAYYLGMNYPLRFLLFGILLTLASQGFAAWPLRADFRHATRVVGLLYLFVSLWLLSIFGNYGDMASWQDTRQIELFHWSLLFAMAAGLSVWHGIRYDDGLSRGFGVTFLFLNLYTRFFEHFWEATHKALFFAILGASFWWLGSRAERIWHGAPCNGSEKNPLSE